MRGKRTWEGEESYACFCSFEDLGSAEVVDPLSVCYRLVRRWCSTLGSALDRKVSQLRQRSVEVKFQTRRYSVSSWVCGTVKFAGLNQGEYRSRVVKHVSLEHNLIRRSGIIDNELLLLWEV